MDVNNLILNLKDIFTYTEGEPMLLSLIHI